MTQQAPPAADTQLLLSQQDNARLRQELAALQRELDDVAHSIGHDLRAPLRHITAYAGLLQEELGGALSADAISYLTTITASAQHMGRLIDGLMALSRVGRVALQLASVQARPLIDEALASLAPQLHGRRIDWRIADGLPAVRADAGLLRELWRQVLANAVKFSARREVAVIEVGAHVQPDGLTQWYVQDNGAGFNPQHAGKLLQVFARLHSVSDYEGLGLGLALVKRIVLRHGGSVAVTSAGVDQGCRVSWTLPLA
jgi:light-regulated signal transduction histidine kinase (bacteriophytochrome)